jgi:hypothetical protein
MPPDQKRMSKLDKRMREARMTRWSPTLAARLAELRA